MTLLRTPPPPTTVPTQECPKCGFACQASVVECPRCQVVIKKAGERQREWNEESSLGAGSSLARLDETDRLGVKQQVERLEAWTGIETANKYNVMDSMGNTLFYADEESGELAQLLSRLFLKASRPFTMNISTPHGEPVLQLDRPFRFFFHEIRVANAQGTILGTVQRLFSIVNRRYKLTQTNGGEIYELFGPLFRPWTFKIRRNGQEVGKIVKKWSGWGREIFTDADSFGVEFPQGIDARLKAVFLGAVFLIDFAHFEDNNNN